MSIVSISDGTKSSINLDVLRDIAAKNNIKIPTRNDEEAYLLFLQSAEAVAQIVDDLPDYIDPRLAPIPTEGGVRKYWKSEQNSHNGWSHQAKLVASKPTSDLLKGRTIVIKDNISVAGLPYTCGMYPQLLSRDGKYPIPDIDASVVRRLLEAGATIVGTSTCENYSLTPLSYTSANGPVQNPWLRGHNTAGSSSGSACLLSLRKAREAGVPGLEEAGADVDIAMGGDQAGSIRMPAAFCGLYGLKPTHGLVPYTGIAGLHPMIDYTGPMATNLADIALTLTVLAGYDGLDPRMTAESPLRHDVTQYHKELSEFVKSVAASELGKGLRVGLISEAFTAPGMSAEVAQTVKDAAVKHFTSAGATVSDISIPMHLLAPSIWTAANRNTMADLTLQARIPDILTHNMPHFSPRWPTDQEWYDLMTRANPAVVNVLFGSTMLQEKFGPQVQAKAHRHVFQLREAYDKALAGYDVLITPTIQTVAPPLPDMRPESEGGSTVLEKIKLAVGATNQTCPFNASGHPALSVPCGWGKSKDGTGWLPIGMQIIGKRWDEMMVLKAAAVFEAGGGGLGKWPGLIN